MCTHKVYFCVLFYQIYFTFRFIPTNVFTFSSWHIQRVFSKVYFWPLDTEGSKVLDTIINSSLEQNSRTVYLIQFSTHVTYFLFGLLFVYGFLVLLVHASLVQQSVFIYSPYLLIQLKQWRFSIFPKLISGTIFCISILLHHLITLIISVS